MALQAMNTGSNPVGVAIYLADITQLRVFRLPLLPSCCHGFSRFEGCDEVRSTARCQVSVSHRHVDRAVPQPLLDLIQGYARDCELAREAVPKVVPANLSQTSPTACAPQPLV